LTVREELHYPARKAPPRRGNPQITALREQTTVLQIKIQEDRTMAQNKKSRARESETQAQAHYLVTDPRSGRLLRLNEQQIVRWNEVKDKPLPPLTPRLKAMAEEATRRVYHDD
jgi:hypothetical protein